RRRCPRRSPAAAYVARRDRGDAHRHRVAGVADYKAVGGLLGDPTRQRSDSGRAYLERGGHHDNSAGTSSGGEAISSLALPRWSSAQFSSSSIACARASSAVLCPPSISSTA